MAKQINVFLENRPGSLNKITAILHEAGINLRAMEIQDREDFGIMKLLVNDPDKALLALSDAGIAAAVKDILVIAIKDQPGGLNALAQIFEEEEINMLDAYGFVVESQKEAVWCVEVEEIEKTIRAVKAKGFRILTDDELYEL